MKKGEAIIRS